MRPFDIGLEFVLSHEGGYSNDPDDPGKETNFGISKASHPDLDIAKLTRDDAALIYYREYWAPAGCAIMDTPLAVAVFDFAVNSGVRRAGLYLRLVDSKLDSRTRALKLTRLRAEFLWNLSHNPEKPNLAKFGRGWQMRCLDLAGLVGGL